VNDDRAYVSGSALNGVNACAGSAALPKIAHTGAKADAGSAFHDHARDRTTMTPGDAAARIAEHAERWRLDEVSASILAARARSWEWQPPPGTLSEVALGLFEDGSVHLVTGGRGTYQAIPPHHHNALRVATRVDFFWAEPHPLVAGRPPQCPPGSLLWGCDLKTGSDTWVEPVEHNLQALAAAVLPALWTGARAAVPAIVYPGPGQGEWDVPPAPLDYAGILRGRDLLLEIVARANEQRTRAIRQLPLALTEGGHCTWCDSAIYCPAKVASLKEYLGNPRPFEAVELTADEAVRVAQLLPAFERFAKSAREALERRVDAHGVPIPMGDGTVWGPEVKPKKTIDPVLGFQAVKAAVGEEIANASLDIKITETGIRRAVKALHARTGVTKQGAATVRAIFRELRAADAIGSRTETTYHRWRPPPVIEGAPAGERLALTVDASAEIDHDPDDE
jgi:hypothetical protein